MGLFVTLPVFAGGPMPMFHTPSYDINMAYIQSDTQSMANTGMNLQLNSVDVNKAHVDDINVYGHNYLRTGDALAESNSSIMANKQFGCDYCGYNQWGSNVELNTAMVKTLSLSLADSGNNQQANTVEVKRAGADDIRICADDVLNTGDATARSSSWTVVNTSWSGWGFN